MFSATPHWKSLIAYFLAGVFACFVVFDAVSSIVPTQPEVSQNASLTKAHEDIIVLRDAGSEVINYCTSARTLACSYEIILRFETPLMEIGHEFALLVSLSLRNVFYVFVSSLAP